MTNTAKSFKDKWNYNKQLAFSETLREGSDIFSWILGRNGFKTAAKLKSYLKDKKRVLDAGCGNGRVTALLRKYSDPRKTEIIGVDLVSAGIAEKNLSQYKNVKIFKKDLTKNLDGLGGFDFIYCQEVLHHVKDPAAAFLNVCKRLTPGGEIAIYVYKKKAPIREFVDDYVRERISKYPYKYAMKACNQITCLGKLLSECGTKIKIPDVDILEIKAGEYSFQRFIYHFFMKCFWNPEMPFKDNSAINYDWYHPQDASRHTLYEVRGWFKKGKLRIVHECADLYGITIRGRLNNDKSKSATK